MFLTDEEKGILDGAGGEPQRLALRVLTKLGEACGAERMVEIASAHLVASSYQIAGEAGIAIYGQLVKQGARVKVRTTSDPGSIDFARWQQFKTPAEYAARQIEIARLLDRMGLIPTWTCTPYATFNPFDNAALAYSTIGQQEKALGLASEAVRLDPKDLQSICAVGRRQPQS